MSESTFQCHAHNVFSAVLQIPEKYRLERGPVHLHGDVSSGFGRGSRQLGFATANLPPKPLATGIVLFAGLRLAAATSKLA